MSSFVKSVMHSFRVYANDEPTQSELKERKCKNSLTRQRDLLNWMNQCSHIYFKVFIFGRCNVIYYLMIDIVNTVSKQLTLTSFFKTLSDV